MLSSVCVLAQSPAAPQPSGKKNAVIVRSVAVQQEADGTAIEITSNGPVVPTVTKLDGPARLVVDLPGAINTVRRSLGPEASDIRGVRINQFQQNPPITRVVVDLIEPRNYFWEMVQDKLVVHLRPLAEAEAPATEPAPATPVFTQGIQPVASTSNVAGSATVMLAGSRIAPGSSITAGEDTAILNLSRGGQVRVCPGTTISVTTSPNGRDLMLGMSTGSVETHYGLANSADSILTPDFRILLPGPGEFHYAVSADSKGNTCVRALPGNAASAVVSELIGDGTYQVKPNQEVVFRGGQLAKVDANVPGDCGCPTRHTPVLRAEALPSDLIPAQTVSASNAAITEEEEKQPVLPSATIMSSEPRSGQRPDDSEMASAASPETAPLPPAKANEAHVIVEAPLVFRASDPPPIPLTDARRLPPLSRRGAPLAAAALPPTSSPAGTAPPQSATAPSKAQPSRGFFGSIKHFFARIFG